MSKQFSHQIKVYYEDTDSGGVVYYANYLKFLERARSEAIYELGLTNKKLLEKYGILIIVKSCNINYKKSARLEDKLNIFLLHYAGKSKPWTIKGALHPTSSIYQDIYRKLFNKKYHIVSNWKIIGLVDFLSLITSKHFFKVRYKFSYVYYVLKYLIIK